MRFPVIGALALLLAFPAVGPVRAQDSDGDNAQDETIQDDYDGAVQDDQADLDDGGDPDQEAPPTAETLAPYGSWVDDGTYGRVWHPTVDVGWRPYVNGYWAWSPYGWTWVSSDPWGLTFHYGRWALAPVGWVWVPGTVWGPAWVDWYESDGFVGWAPLGPSVTHVTVIDRFVFVRERDFCDHGLRRVVVDHRRVPREVIHAWPRRDFRPPPRERIVRVAREPVTPWHGHRPDRHRVDQNQPGQRGGGNGGWKHGGGGHDEQRPGTMTVQPTPTPERKHSRGQAGTRPESERERGQAGFRREPNPARVEPTPRPDQKRHPGGGGGQQNERAFRDDRPGRGHQSRGDEQPPAVDRRSSVPDPGHAGPAPSPYQGHGAGAAQRGGGVGHGAPAVQPGGGMGHGALPPGQPGGGMHPNPGGGHSGEKGEKGERGGHGGQHGQPQGRAAHGRHAR